MSQFGEFATRQVVSCYRFLECVKIKTKQKQLIEKKRYDLFKESLFLQWSDHQAYSYNNWYYKSLTKKQ